MVGGCGNGMRRYTGMKRRREIIKRND